MRSTWLTLCLSSLFCCRTNGKTPPVNVALRASFNQPPYLVELLETAAEANATSYFPILDRIASGYFQGDSTDQELYTKFLSLVQDDGHLSNPEDLSSFKLALSIHSTAPRIESHYQYYQTAVEPSVQIEDSQDNLICVHSEEKQYCGPQLGTETAQVTGSAVQDLPFDRVRDGVSDRPSAILYADITSPKFREAYAALNKDNKYSYRVRYKPSGKTADPLPVHGYGVELALKRTDYIVIDDRQEDDSADKAASEATGKAIEATLDENEDVEDLKPLSASELSGLGVKASTFILNSQDPLDKFLKLSQDFPKHSSAMSTINASSDFVEEWRETRGYAIPGGYNVFWINGVPIDARQIDPYSLLDHIRRERKLVNGIRKLGFSGQEAISILSSKEISQTQKEDDAQRYDFRDELEGGNIIMWMNDVENDKRYEDWPGTLMALMQRTFPGQLPPVRRDIHNVIIPTDFSNVEDVAIVVETLQNFVKRKVPIRIGLVPLTTTQAATEQARIVYHLKDTYGLSAALQHLEMSLSLKALGSPNEKIYTEASSDRKVRRDQVPLAFSDLMTNEDVEVRIHASRKYLYRLGANVVSAPIFANGVPIPKNDEWLQTMSQRITLDLRIVQRGIFEELFQEDTWLPSIFLVEAATKRNALVVPDDEKSITLVDLGGLWEEHVETLEKLPSVSADESTEREDWAYLMVFGDFGSPSGSALLTEAVKYSASHRNVEVLFAQNGDPSGDESSWSQKLLRVEDAAITPELTSKLGEIISAVASEVDSESFLQRLLTVARSFGFQPGQNGLILNGRSLQIPGDSEFGVEDFESLLAYEKKKRLIPTAEAVKALNLSDRINSPLVAAKLSATVASSTISDVPEGIFDNGPAARVSILDSLNVTKTAITKGDKETASIQIFAAIDPASENAQRWVPMVKTLSELHGVHLRLYLNPKDKIDELPVKRFYRYVLESEPSFDASGRVKGLRADFAGLPAEALLTMGMDVPASWLVAPEESVHDLDNIKLSSAKSYEKIEANYDLEHILIEGHSRDLTAGMPPRGAQLSLGTKKEPHVADTIIMANLGYFQFKANPGIYKLDLRPGRSEEIFQIDSAGTKGWNPQPGDESTEIALMSFQGTTLFPRLSRKEGKEEEDVLEASTSVVDELANKAADFADKLLSKVGFSGKKATEMVSKGSNFVLQLASRYGLATNKRGLDSAHADINIFSVASGHLYERMLNIMMLSVMRNTKYTVKFWFIEQFLSPSFKAFLPTMAEEYGFKFEMVTYKWPHWLRAQKEKQRIIWGYKILFLDVLFPLDLDKVIFVDADQIVRTDMYDLVTHDLEGAPYGFTPMCDSRTEMEGFRFWKQGYWKSFLKGLPYHISALYVVDLKRFRQIAAGDRLRQQYHQLSADPNSLSNLDQDLPNNMQMMLPIHSLPQEWLWCETWCSDESQKEARTIDLCNNPQTKEPKLDRARRQVPEWTEYDDEIGRLAKRVKGQAGAGGEGVQETEEKSKDKPEAGEERERDEL